MRNTNEYVNKAALRDLLIEYQNNSTNIDDKWIKKYTIKIKDRANKSAEEILKITNNKKDFLKFKQDEIDARIQQLANMSGDEIRDRQVKANKLKEEIATIFVKIVSGIMSTYEFNNVEVDYSMRMDMQSEALWDMNLYIDRFDTRLKNPFSYFTEIAKNACRRMKESNKQWRYKFQTVDFSDNLDDEDGTHSWGEE